MDASADLLKVNHRLESRVPEIGLLGSEGGATSSVVPTPISSLSVSDLSGKDRFPSCSTPVLLEVLVADHQHHLVSHCFGCAAQRDVPRRISRLGFRPQFAALFIHDAFTANDNDILLQIVEMLYTLNEVFHIKRMFRHEDDVWTSVGRSKCDVAGMPTHYLDNGDLTMALGRCPEPFDAID